MQPAPTSVRTQSTQRTGLAICSVSASRTEAASSTGVPEKFATSGTSRSLQSSSSMVSARLA